MVISIRMTDEEKQLVEAYAKINGVSLSESIKRTYFEKIEDDKLIILVITIGHRTEVYDK